MVISPTVSGAHKRLSVYGTLEMGDVPRSARMENPTPTAIIRSPTHRYTTRRK